MKRIQDFGKDDDLRILKKKKRRHRREGRAEKFNMEAEDGNRDLHEKQRIKIKGYRSRVSGRGVKNRRIEEVETTEEDGSKEGGQAAERY
jgi:hypothetical protein